MSNQITQQEAQDRANAGLYAYVVWASNGPAYFADETDADAYADTLSWYEWQMEDRRPVERVLAEAKQQFFSAAAARRRERAARRRGFPGPVKFASR